MTISLEKRAELVSARLTKINLTKVPVVRVGLALDVSGSARWLFENGTMQETVNRVQAVALKFDDNGELDMWTFSNGSTPFNRLTTAKASDYNDYVNREILNNRKVSKWNGTDYAPVLRDMRNYWFPSGGLSGFFSKSSSNSKIPAMGILITDGENYDRPEAAKVLKDAASVDIYWQLIGIGDANFSFLREQADLLPNAGFVNLSSLSMSDEELYEKLLAKEFADWIKARTP